MAASSLRSTRSSALRDQEPPEQKTKQPATANVAAESSGSNHLWTDRERIVLTHLNELLPYQPDNRAIIFNTIFSAQHTAAGLPAGRDHAALRAQYSEKTRRDRSGWDKVKAGPQGRKEEREWRELESRVRSAARQMDVAIKRSVDEEAVPRGGEGGRRSQGREAGKVKSRRPNEKLKQQAVRRSRKGGKFVKEEKAKKHVSNGEEQQVTDGRMCLGQPNNEQDEQNDELLAPPTLNDTNNNLDGRNQAQHIQHGQHIPTLTAPLLSMIHTSQIEWASTDAFWTASTRDGLAPISTASDTYAAGGKIHRVYDINSQPHDYLLCNPRFCKFCSTTASDSASAKNHTSNIFTTSNLPFVHAKDVKRIDDGWNFTPSRGEGFDRQTTGYTQSFPRNVKFGDGVMRTVAVCTYAKCRVCREHTQVQKEKGIDPGDMAEG
ncbi:hypothetical protein DOTSEDRAFT_19109 [Dothistroma septosporum NZE10]|uniref:Uncharacterized protein n=1 Tax=Dothistroma septosporum (strain NZE10 / CBS 128990) TaxID=675120 RepID=N1Q1Q9_DOTSN|nr:hypothetical protein DOTSEDRAFT_19109 [Dothistroma septosporum NZE10]